MRPSIEVSRAQKFFVLIFLAVPFLCCLGGVLVFNYSLRNTGEQLRSELAEARSLGIPTGAQDLAVQNEVKPSDNAAPIYLAAIDKERTDPKLKRLVTELGSGKGDGKGAEPILALVAKAASKPGCRFERKWNQGLNLDYPEFKELKRYVKASAERAKREGRSGNWQAALQSLAVGRRISEHMGQDPSMIAMLARTFGEASVELALWQVARANAQVPGFIPAAIRFEEQAAPLPLIRDRIAADFALQMETISNLGRLVSDDMKESNGMDPDRSVQQAFDSPFIKSGVQERLVRSYLQVFREMPSDPNDLDGAQKALDAMQARSEKDRSPFNAMNLLISPTYHGIPDFVRHLVSLRRLNRCGLGMLAKGKASGLTAAPPGCEMDPFADKAFMYRPNPKGFILYGVGRNRIDDGGNPSDRKQKDDVIQFP